MALLLGRKVCGTTLRKTCTLLESLPLKSRNRGISSSLLMERCDVFDLRFQQLHLMVMLKLSSQNQTVLKKQLLLPDGWCFQTKPDKALHQYKFDQRKQVVFIISGYSTVSWSTVSNLHLSYVLLSVEWHQQFCAAFMHKRKHSASGTVCVSLCGNFKGHFPL